jgi:Flp pilus assembly protein TadD
MPDEEAFQKALSEGHSAAWDQDWAKAEECFRRALQESPNQPKALNSLGLALYQLGKFEESLATYVRASRLTPEDPLPLEKIAQLSERLGDINVALDASMKAAESFLRQQEIDKAIENWNRVTGGREQGGCPEAGEP